MLNTATSLTPGNQMIGAQMDERAAAPQQASQIQICVAYMEEEAKRLRAVVEHLAGRLHDVVVPAEPKAGAQSTGTATPATCPLTDILAAQIGHIAVSRSIVEDLLGRIQL